MNDLEAKPRPLAVIPMDAIAPAPEGEQGMDPAELAGMQVVSVRRGRAYIIRTLAPVGLREVVRRG